MVSALASVGAVRIPALAVHCVVFFDKTFTLIVPLFTQVCKWVSVNLLLMGNPALV